LLREEDRVRPAPYFTDRDVTIWHGNALDLPLDDATVDLVVTSPPYFGLRSYTDAGAHYTGQLGSEATPGEFVDALIAATAEMVRVLKPSGSIWVNLGDKYAGGGGPMGVKSRHSNKAGSPRRTPEQDGARPKSLLGLPWRYALRCIDDLGLILRAEVIWSKPNGLPESVTDRVRRSHEQWFHFTKSPRYYSAVDEIREPHRYPDDARANPRRESASKYEGAMSGRINGTTHALGSLPGSVWTIPTQPLTVPPELDVDHFAAFPMEWPRRIIQGWSPAGICVDCGEGRRPVSASEKVTSRPGFNVRDQRMPGRHASGNQGREGRAGDYLTTLTGYACACAAPTAPTRPAVVLDPFGGTGTVALMARVLGRRAHHVDLSADYCRLARWRVTDPGERARAMQVDKPAPPPAGVDALFDLEPTPRAVRPNPPIGVPGWRGDRSPGAHMPIDRQLPDEGVGA
jgi:DNA modification methylase